MLHAPRQTHAQSLCCALWLALKFNNATKAANEDQMYLSTHSNNASTVFAHKTFKLNKLKRKKSISRCFQKAHEKK